MVCGLAAPIVLKKPSTLVTVRGAVNGWPSSITDKPVCPLTKMPLIYDRDAQELISRTAGLAFPIRHGVPLMIADAARELDDADLLKLAHRSA